MKFNKIESRLSQLTSLVTVRNHLKNMISGSLNISKDNLKKANSLVSNLDKLFLESCLEDILPRLDGTAETVSREEIELAIKQDVPQESKPVISGKKVKTKAENV